MRKLSKVLGVILSIMITVGMFFGCSSMKVESKESIIVTDQLGREVEIDKVPEKIVSSYYISTSLLVNLGVKDKLVGIEGKANTRELYKKASPELIDLPTVGNSKEINVEECASLEADLVIIPARLESFIEKFEALNIPVIAIEPETLDGFMESVDLLSKAVGKEEEGKELNAYYKSIIEKVEGLTKDVTDKPKVYLSGSDSILKTCTSKMYQNYLIELCGGENVTSNLTDGYWSNISVEELIKYNPEKIYMVGYATYSKEDVLKDSTLQTIEAIKNKDVYTFPSTLEAWDYPTPSSILGMLWLTNNLYPEKYSEEEYKMDATEFYKKFYGIDVTEEEIGL